ncbi:MAG TPA: YceI family protein [Phycisphaerales bacterium]|nr:YceI family protein [Phycisphaerales bacterium]
MTRFALLATACLAAGVAAFAPVSFARPVEAPAQTFTIDPVHSSVVFKIRHNNLANFFGRFNDVSGTIAIDDATLSASKLEVTVKIDSIDTNSGGRDKHLKSPDFFDAEKFPTSTFVGKTFEKGDADTYKITGDMTLHGVTKPLTIEFHKTGAVDGRRGPMTGYECTFNLKRSDYGLGAGGPGMGDEVTLFVALEAGVKKDKE